MTKSRRIRRYYLPPQIMALVCLILRGKDPEMLLETFEIILILVAAVFMASSDATSQDLAPVIGLLGTVAGYLMGRKPPSTYVLSGS